MGEQPPAGDGGGAGGSGGGRRPRKRRPAGSGGTGGRPTGGRPSGGRPQSRGGRPAGAGGQHGSEPPIEIAVRSSRNVLRRHAESVRDEQSQVACRGIVSALVGACRGVSSPAEALDMAEKVVHVLEAGRREDLQLPVTLRAVIGFALETPRRQKDVAEMLRLLLRHSYVLAADHIPRQLRDDGGFRGTALLSVWEDVAPEYLDDQKFAALASR